MSNPPDLSKLEPDDIERLTRLLKTLRMVDGWCRVNRWIGKTIILGGVALLVMLSDLMEHVQKALSKIVQFFH